MRETEEMNMKVNGLYVSEWDDGIEIQSEAVIDLETKEVTIGKHLYDYDFDSMDLEILNREFIVIDGEEYPCCVKGSADGDYWYEQPLNQDSIQKWRKNMDYNTLSDKYIRNGIEWLTETFDTYKGMTTTMETDEVMTEEQLNILCQKIREDSRVEIAMIESVKESTITITFWR